MGDIEKVRIAQPETMQGRFNVLPDGRIGRFGWKAQTATLVEFMGEAFRDEIGITNPLAVHDLVSGCGASILRPEADAAPLTSLVAFLNTIDPPVPTTACLGSRAPRYSNRSDVPHAIRRRCQVLGTLHQSGCTRISCCTT